MKRSTPLFRSPLCKIDYDLTSITDIGDEYGGDDSARHWQPHQQRIARAVEAWYRTAAQPFISVCIRKGGRVLYHRSIGHQSGTWSDSGMASDGVPATVDTPVCLFSASKALTGLLIHGLAEDGLLDLDRPVAHYLPKFAQHGKQHITVSEVLSHQAGIPRLPRDLPINTLFDTDAVVDALCAQSISKIGGQRTAYHALSGGFILGAIAQAVSGRNLNQILRRRLTVPLNLSSTRYGATINERKKIATNYMTNGVLPFPISHISTRALGAPWETVVDISNQTQFLDAIIPAANVYSTSADWCTFMELLRCGGNLNGQQIFSTQTVKRATKPATSTFFDQTLCMPMRYSEGLMLGGHPFGVFGVSSEQSFGHVGFINVFGWADPMRKTSVAILSTGKPLIGLHYIELARVINAINA